MPKNKNNEYDGDVPLVLSNILYEFEKYLYNTTSSHIIQGSYVKANYSGEDATHYYIDVHWGFENALAKEDNLEQCWILKSDVEKNLTPSQAMKFIRYKEIRK